MAKYTIACLMIVLSLVGSSMQSLNKQTLFSGLSSLDFSFLKTPQRRSVSDEADKGLCSCNGAQPQSVRAITYHNSPNQKLVLCICPNPVMSSQYMTETMGKVPYAIRRNNVAMVSATVNTCGGAGSSNDISFYCDKAMDVTVFIHESAHSFDKGKSSSQEWQNAIAKDSCVPDAYANTNYVEDFAQVVVVWVHLVGKKLDKNFGGTQYACMKNQLQQMAKYLPASSLNL